MNLYLLFKDLVQKNWWGLEFFSHSKNRNHEGRSELELAVWSKDRRWQGGHCVNGPGSRACETNKVTVLLCWPQGAPLGQGGAALATKAEEHQLLWELDMHLQINQSLRGARRQLKGRGWWWRQNSVFLPQGVNLESKRWRERVGNEHVSCGINSGQADSQRKEYSKNQSPQSIHL